MADVKKNIQIIRDKIREACERSGRREEDILLLGVTKTIGQDLIQCAIDEGVCELGENRPQELKEKYPLFEGVKWHLIGHLQTNKVKYIIDKAELIHSVYTEKLAAEIDRQAKKIDKVQKILIEVNVSGEESKGGISPEEVEQFVINISKYPNIRISGFMTMAPLGADKVVVREIFRKMHNIYVDISTKKYDNVYMEYLSMGMSNDFETAIEEGANIIRVGSKMFKI